MELRGDDRACGKREPRVGDATCSEHFYAFLNSRQAFYSKKMCEPRVGHAQRHDAPTWQRRQALLNLLITNRF